MSATVYLRVQRLSRALTAAARRCSVSDLYEVLQPAERWRAPMSSRMRPLVPGLHMAGSAITVQPARGDNLMMHRALTLARRGDVLVVAAGGGPGAQWGDLAAVYARRIGLAGVVVHGPIRDADALRTLRFPVWATEIAPSHPDKKGAGNVNAAVDCDGVRVCPGDLVVADGDGVIVVPRERARDAVDKVGQRRRAEQRAARRIAAGASLWDLHGLDGAYRKSGVVERDECWNGPRANAGANKR